MKEILILVPTTRPGILADITGLLAERGVNILQIDGTDDHEHAVLRLEAEPYDEALRVLTAAGYHAMSEEVLVIRIQDEPGAIARVAARFREPQININAIRFLRRDQGWATVILSTNDNAKARVLLADCLVNG
ncbi:MAG: ACT domain-containing protein [Luteolibacter sp.]